MVFSGISPWDPQSQDLLRWGANFGPLTMQHQWWRLLTSMFVHIGLLHLLVNMWGLWVLGRVGEYLYGNWRLVALYLLSGLGGSVASLARNPMVVSAGASGALFGIAGALVGSSLFGGRSSHLRLPYRAMRSLIVVIAANLAFGLLYTRIDNGAHVGGLGTGFVLGAVLSLDFRWARQARRASPSLLLFPLAAVLIAGFAFYVQKLRGPDIDLVVGTRALQRGDAVTAVRELRAAVESRPNDSGAHQSLGTAYALARQPSLARKEYERALQLDPPSVKLRQELAVVDVQLGHPEAAVQLLQEAAQRSPGDAQVFFQLGLLLQTMGKDQQAVPQLQKAAALQPNFAPTLQALGISYSRLQQFQPATEAFEQAHKLAPGSPDVLMALANLYEARGMSREADEAYQEAYALRHPPKKN
jgi:rhomboid protease GluP